MRIDAHQHFWHYNPRKHEWINEEMSVIKRDFLPTDLKLHLDQFGIHGSIAVQADQSEEETEYLLNLAEKNTFIKGVVGWVDLRAEMVRNRLDYYSQFRKLKGFRHVLQDDPDVNFILDRKFQEGLSQLKDYGFSYDILIRPAQLKAALETVKRHPEQIFVLDHLAKPEIKMGCLDEWAYYMEEMAKHPNVWCKISGLITEAEWNNWTQEDFQPYLEIVTEVFGVDRLMYGSDWPVCLLSGDYKSVLGLVDCFFANFSEESRMKIFGGNAAKFYGIN